MVRRATFLHGILGLVLVALTACSSVSRGSLESIRLAMRRPSVHPTAESVAATPYFQMQANGPDGEAILILARVANGELGWYGSGHDVLFTRDGLVVKTIGLPQNLDDSAIPGANPFHDGLQHLVAPVDYTRRLDWSPDYRYGVLAQARLEPKALEDVDILGTVHRLRRIDEHVSVPSAGVSMTNRYWVDPADGFIWKSRQYVAPGLPLELIQLQPYRGSASAEDTGKPAPGAPQTGARLSDAGAAQITPDAYLLGAAWLQPSLKREQLRLRAGLDYELGAIRNQALGSGDMAVSGAARDFQAWLSGLPVTGRHAGVPLDPVRLEVTPTENRPMEDGDTLVYPPRPADVRVVGAVEKPCRLPHVPMQDARLYLSACPGSDAADPNLIYVVQPDGTVAEQGIALWNRDKPRPLAPGAWIYVPFDRHAIAGAADANFNRDVAAFLATQVPGDSGWR
ncbi:YjbF family lipoprotein [Luteibacter yeojuensis]|uniref:Capsule biosynthesis GfcC-like C-terminal domain-containing protein n=1 Tax=Luteibacter yeojuensis TaxID=345309 RepID=A0A7X5TPK2_9GAMM|nr:YjbF family lipoprotein [Luteibacter yeojuensis]NID14567.1 hypothetical protein [Luteibacter yeojuensis]